MKLDPRLFEMQAKVWRDPETERNWVEKDRLRRAEEKKKLEEEKHRKKVEIEMAKIERIRLKETGRLVLMGKEDLHLAKLKADVSRLEAKEKASLTELPSIRMKETGRFRAIEHGNSSADRIGSRADLANQRQELSQYRHTLDHPSVSHRLPQADIDRRLEEKMADFTIRATGDSLLDLRILHQRDPLSLELDLELPRNHHQFMPREREEIEIRLGEQQRELEDAMIREAIELGANALIDFCVEGPFPIEHGELVGRHLLVASGIPVQLAQSRPRQAATNRHDRLAPRSGWRNFDSVDHFDRFDGRHEPQYRSDGWHAGGPGWHDHRDLYPNTRDAGWHIAPPTQMEERGWRNDGEWRNVRDQGEWSRDAAAGWRGVDGSPRRKRGWGDRFQSNPYPPPYPHDQYETYDELERLPWGAQAYVRQMRERQERELREQNGHYEPPRLDRTAPFVPRDDPALFGNSFAHPPYPQTPPPIRPPALGQDRFASVNGQYASRWERPTMDPDHRAGGIEKSTPWSPGAMPW